jgi:uncharacterized iron-regulated membrane protein
MTSPTFRQSLARLHTWAGVVIGLLLFVIFWMGSLSVFDREIDRWMMPMTRLAPPSSPALPSLDATARPVAERLAAGASPWTLLLPTPRVPTVELRFPDGAGELVRRHVDPASGRLLADSGSAGGNGFFFPFHYKLHLKTFDLGYWLVGFAGMTMLVLLVSGVIIHRRIFSDFFTFRPTRALPRATLDLHNLSGVLALPFHFVITLSGLIIFFAIYFPVAWQSAYAEAGPDARKAFNLEAFGTWQRPPAGVPGPLASLDAMLAAAEREWQGGRPYLVRVWHPGDAASYVELRRSVADDIPMNLDTLYFDGATGAVLHRHQARPVMHLQRFIAGLHFIQFEHWTLRWLYFLAGLSGCLMIATGQLFWLEARRARHLRQGRAGVRAVEALTVGGTAGLVVATAAFLVANRLLPLELEARAALEMRVCFAAWALAFVHGGWRAAHAWREQAWAIAVLAAAAVVLNGLTTGDHLARTLAAGHWAVAGVDGVLLSVALTAGVAARRLGRRNAPAPAGAGAGAAELGHG